MLAISLPSSNLADSSRSSCVGLYCDGARVGLIKPSILPHLLLYRDVFVADETDGVITGVRLAHHLSNVEQRTTAVNGVFMDLQLKGHFPCLKGWRNEVLEICAIGVLRIVISAHSAFIHFSSLAIRLTKLYVVLFLKNRSLNCFCPMVQQVLEATTLAGGNSFVRPHLSATLCNDQLE